VAVGTRIQERHLRALERDAPLEEFPSPAYARFFLREYAEYLRLDPAPLLREFDSRHAPEEEDASPAPAPAPPRVPRPGWRVLVVVSIAALAFVAALPSVLRSADETPTQQPTVAATTPPPDVSPDPEPAPVVREPNGVRAVLRLTEASWVEAVADGEVLEAATLEPGTSVVYRARESLELTLGNAGGVRLRVGGEPVETGDTGEVVTLGFTWQDGEVLSDP
jgi:cytoskeletal protein RodZ